MATVATTSFQCDWVPEAEKGDDAVSYSIIITPNAWTLDSDGNLPFRYDYNPTLKVIKTEGKVRTTSTESSTLREMVKVYADGKLVQAKWVYTGSQIDGVPQYAGYVEASDADGVPYRSIRVEVVDDDTVLASESCSISQDGFQGEDAVSVVVSPPSVVSHNGVLVNVPVWIDLYVGNERVAPDGIAKLTEAGVNKTDATTGLRWSYLQESGRAGYALSATPLKQDLILSSYLTYNGKEYPFSLEIVRVDDGQQGVPGPDRKPLRVRKWASVPNNSWLTTGLEETDNWTDIVYVENGSSIRYWRCVQKFQRTASQTPPEPTDTTTTNPLKDYLLEIDAYQSLATDIFLANYALIKNLGVEVIDMRDAYGNLLFRAKDGDVTCNTGTFKNVEVKGALTAETLDLKISTLDHYGTYSLVPNGSIVLNPVRICLPDLPEGMVRTIRVLNALETRSGEFDLILNRASENIRISKTLSAIDAEASQVTLPALGANSNTYIELLGYNKDGLTYWLTAEIKKYNQL